MGTSTAQIAEVREEIARSRRQLFGTVEVFEERMRERKEDVVDRVSPSRVWQRKTAGVRQRWDDMSTSISEMTSSGMTAGRVSPMAGSGSKIRGQAQEISGRAEGNPMAAGLVALGAGFLVAALLPPTEREREAAQRLMKEIEPLKRQASTIGRQMANELQPIAEGSVEQLKERATDAVEQVKQESQGSARQVKGEAEEATASVKQRAASASGQVKQTSTGSAAGSGSGSASGPRRSPRRAPIRAR